MLYFFYRDGKEWWKYRQILNKIMLKDLNVNFIKFYKVIINDLLLEWENNNGQVIPNLITDLYKLSISCKFFINYYMLRLIVYVS